MKFESLGTSCGGLDIPLIKITNKTKKDGDEQPKQKPIIFIIGRQHSGETHSSFIIHGFLNYLTSRNVLSQKMRDKFEFWVAPIVNPDGVVIGNYRCNTQGRDMNRHFFSDDDPEGAKNRLVEVELIRSYLKEKVPKSEGALKMFLDIHAHSSMQSIFCYSPSSDDPGTNQIIRRFPMLLDNMSAYF
jgi:hypothetical protein